MYLLPVVWIKAMICQIFHYIAVTILRGQHDGRPSCLHEQFQYQHQPII